MATGKTDPDRRERILAAVLDLIAEDGVAGVSHRKAAARAGVPLVPAYMLRVGETARFTANFLPPITPSGDAVAEQAAIEAVIEPVVRRHLEQWLMLYAFRPDR